MKAGIYSGIPNADYHHGPGISKSGLDLISRSPLHYKAVLDAENDNEPTPAQAIGTALHCAVLEPDVFVQEYCLALQRSDVPHAIDDRDQLVAMVQELNAKRLPKLPTSGSKAELTERILSLEASHLLVTADSLSLASGAELKAMLVAENELRPGLLPTSGSRHELAYLLRENGVDVTLWSDCQAEWQQNNGHRKVLTKETWDQVAQMRHAIMAHPAASALLLKGQNVVIDLKTCEDASLDGFSKSIANWRYDVQHPYYLDGLRLALKQSGDQPPAEGAAELSAYWTDPDTGVLCRCRPDFWRGYPEHFAFIAVEKKPPYAVAVYVLDEDSVDIGRAQYRANLRTYAQCLQAGKWPGYGDKVQSISVPRWHANKNQSLLEAI
jgi:exodeoxyribonuclease VIII